MGKAFVQTEYEIHLGRGKQTYDCLLSQGFFMQTHPPVTQHTSQEREFKLNTSRKIYDEISSTEIHNPSFYLLLTPPSVSFSVSFYHSLGVSVQRCV